MASNLYNVLSGLYQGLNLEKKTRKDEVSYLSSVLSGVKNAAGTLANGSTSGMVYAPAGSGDVSIADGIITVNAAGKVKNSFTVFGQEFDGSAPVTVSATTGKFTVFGKEFDGSADVEILTGTNIEIAADGKVSVTSAAITENATGVAIAGDVATAIKNATEAASDELEAVSGVLTGQIKDVDDKVDALSGKVSGAFSPSKVVVGAADGITASAFEIGSPDKTGFGASGELAVESAVVGFVADELAKIGGANALTGITDGTAISSNISDKNATIGVVTDGTTIGADANGLKSLLTLSSITQDASSEYAAVYQLQDKNGNRIGSPINIVKDQFLKTVSYDSTSEELLFTFNVPSGELEVPVDVKDMVHEYQGGAGVSVGNDVSGKSTISAVINKSENDGKFLTLDAENGIGLSGITDAITAATSGKLNQITATNDDIAIFASDGKAVTDSGKKAGADGTDLTAGATANTLAAEVAVNKGYQKLIGAADQGGLDDWLSNATADGTGSLAELENKVSSLISGGFAAV